MGKKGMNIRSARVDDAAAVAKLSGELGYPASSEDMAARLAELLPLSAHHVIVAESEGKLLGFAAVEVRMLLVSGAKAELMGLVVGADARRLGVGKALMDAAKEWSRAQGMAKMMVRSNTVRTESHAFYERLGYAHTKSQHVYVKELAGG